MKKTDSQRFKMLEMMRQRHEEYAWRKAMWIEDHPNATPEEYTDEMRRLADKLEI